MDVLRSAECPWIEVARMGAGPAVVGVPPAQGGYRALVPALGPLADEYAVHLVSARGERDHGRVPTADLAAHVDDLRRAFDLADLERAAIVAISFGGPIAIA